MSVFEKHFGSPHKIATLFLLILLPAIGVACGQNTAHNKADELFEAMDIGPGSWAADVGSGDGDYTIPMAERVGQSGHVFAVDVDDEALEELNEKIKKNDLTNVSSVFSVEDNPMLPANILDAVLVRNAYHHFTAHESMLQHIRSALKPGGRLVIEESVSNDMVGESREEQTDEHDIGIKYVREELTTNGFTIQEEVNPFVEANGHFHWMIIAARPDSES